MSSTTLSSRLVSALARFGVVEVPAQRRFTLAKAREVASWLAANLGPGEVALITGPSGSGKSTLLATLASVLRSRHLRVVRGGGLRLGRVMDRMPPPVERALQVLHAAGLGEPGLWCRRVRELSCGERARLEAAAAVVRASSGSAAWVVLDEFTSVLDRVTARSVCVGVSRLVRRVGRAPLVVAGAHHDVAAWLAPEVIVNLALSGSVHISRRSAAGGGGVPCRP